MTESRTRTRLKVMAALVVVMFSALTTRLWFLQVLAAPKFAALANDNQVRLVPILPLRGQILDRRGRVLVGNRASTVVLVDRQALGSNPDQVLYRLAGVLGVKVRDILDQLNSLKYLPYQPVPVAVDVPAQKVFYLQEHQRLFPGVSYEIDPIRQYPNGELASNLLGYVLPISESQLSEPAFKGYLPGELVGYSGVESTYEPYLHGKIGQREIQVNAQGRVLDDNFGSRPATPGDNLVLSIDERVQQLAEQSLKLGIQLARRTYDRVSGKLLKATGGSVIVMDPRNGQVLAMASSPTYDPSLFLGGLSQREARSLGLCYSSSDQSCGSTRTNNPLINRAIAGLYPAGSTFKPFVAVGALKERIAKTNGSYNCPSGYTAAIDPTGHVFRNWSTVDYGFISLPEALAISCDTVFYDFGYKFWVNYKRTGREMMQQDLEAQGFGRKTGIDIAGEQAGRIPDKAYVDALYKKDPRFYGNCYKDSTGKTSCHPLGWLPGDAINLSIGQGYIQVTPIQLATAYAAIANGGTLYVPHLGYKIVTPEGKVVKTIQPQVAGKLPIGRKQVLFLRSALTGVTTRGTAALAFRGFPLDRIPVAGKTGTADIASLQPTSWFAAMAPANNPRYVVIASIEQGGHGATTAAPMVRRILEGLFGLGTGGSLSAGLVGD